MTDAAPGIAAENLPEVPAGTGISKTALAGGGSGGTVLAGLGQLVGPATPLGMALTMSAPALAVIIGGWIRWMDQSWWAQQKRVEQATKVLGQMLDDPTVSEERKKDVRDKLDRLHAAKARLALDRVPSRRR